MKKVTIYTDGACSGNPGPGGWGAVILHGSGEEKELYGGENSTTNNRMEMIAAIRALEDLREDSTVDLYSDSQYLVKGMTKWIDSWIKNEWRNSEKKPVKNKELWIRLLALSKQHKISWYWVEGHAGHDLNERADRLSKFQCKTRDTERNPIKGE
ncbi:MAG: ribonuclease HI [Holosporaceae bacterium]|jgi:ribonuclease HI|nr:ribonuclease HI [Holosporaceae bacterium]